MLAHLGGIRTHSLHDLKGPSLIVAGDLPPSEMALLPRNMALGFATDVGGRTSTPRSWRAREESPGGRREGRDDIAQQGAIGSWTAPAGRDLRSGSGDACRARAEARALSGIALKLTELRTDGA